MTINIGSSSLKFAVYERNDKTNSLLSGRVDRIGLKDARWVVNWSGGGDNGRRPGGSLGPCHPGAPGRRRELGGGQGGPVGRHEHGLHAGPRVGHGDADRRSRSRTRPIPVAHRGDDDRPVRQSLGLQVGSAGNLGDQFRRQRSAEEAENDVRAAEAIEVFCYHAKKWIGAYAAALGGLETPVFSGGMGENAPEIRRRICAGLEFLGIALNDDQNELNAILISTENKPVKVRLIPTDESLMIARAVARLMPRPS